MSSASPWMGLVFDPLDGLFFRDGRPFGAANRVQSGWPTPQTLAGAIRTTLLTRTGFRFDQFTPPKSGPLEPALRAAGASESVIDCRFRGPFLGLVDSTNAVEPLLPLPLILSRAKESLKWSWAIPVETERQKELGIHSWRDDDGLMPLYRCVETDPKAERSLITLSGIKQFLQGNDPDQGECHSPGDLYAIDHRVGIAINPDSLTTLEGQLYAIGLLALEKKRVGDRRIVLYAEILPGDDSEIDVKKLLHETRIPFGGEGRSVLSTIVTPADWPAPVAKRTSSIWYLPSPTFLPRRQSGRPLPKCDGLRAAASGPGMAVSGWDVARRGPRATRFAIPAGAVYCLNQPGNADDFLDDQLPDYLNLRREGWGFALQGVQKDH